MKNAITCVSLFTTLILLCSGDQYSDRYYNIDAILNNPRLVKAYVMCLLEKGPCTKEGQDLKDNIKEAMETDCANCTDAQKNITRRAMAHMINNEPEYWNELTAMYDPERKYAPKYEQELRA